VFQWLLRIQSNRPSPDYPIHPNTVNNPLENEDKPFVGNIMETEKEIYI